MAEKQTDSQSNGKNERQFLKTIKLRIFYLCSPISETTLQGQVRKPSTLDALTEFFTPSHVKHQRLSLQFLSAPEDGRK
jgi:hypothetical protein